MDPLGVGLQVFGEAQGPPLPEAGIGYGRGPAVEGGGQLGLEGLWVDEDGLQPAARKAKGEGRAGHAGAGDDHVGVHAAICRRRAGAVQPLIRGASAADHGIHGREGPFGSCAILRRAPR